MKSGLRLHWAAGVVLGLGWCVAVVGAEPARPAAPAKAAPAVVFQAGLAERDITPAIGLEQPGGYGKAFHRTLHDACKVRAVVFDDGQKRVALVGLDALVIRRPTVDAARQAIAAQCGIPPENVLIGASHSHSSGPTGMILPGEFDAADPAVRTLAYEKSSCADAGYLKTSRSRSWRPCRRLPRPGGRPLRRGVRRRRQGGLQPPLPDEERAVLHASRQEQSRRAGTGRPHRPAGGCDRRVGRPRQVPGLRGQFRLPCHHQSRRHLGQLDYYMEQAIRGMMGPQSVVVFLQGCCGDITQVDNLNPDVNPAAERPGAGWWADAWGPRPSKYC